MGSGALRGGFRPLTRLRAPGGLTGTQRSPAPAGPRPSGRTDVLRLQERPCHRPPRPEGQGEDVGTRRLRTCREEKQLGTAEPGSTRRLSRSRQISRPQCNFVKLGRGDASRSCRQSPEEPPGRQWPRRQAEGRSVRPSSPEPGLARSRVTRQAPPAPPRTPQHLTAGRTAPPRHRARRLPFLFLKKKKAPRPNTPGRGLNAGTTRAPAACPSRSPHPPRGETPTRLKPKPGRVARCWRGRRGPPTLSQHTGPARHIGTGAPPERERESGA